MEKKKILIIDDEEKICDLIKRYLERCGVYEVRTLTNAKDIIAHVHEFVPDVILLDLIMPGLGGIEVCQMLNGDPVGIGVPIIILSGLGKEADKLKAFSSGVVDYIVKPLDLETLVKAIEKAIEAKRGNNP